MKTKLLSLALLTFILGCDGDNNNLSPTEPGAGGGTGVTGGHGPSVVDLDASGDFVILAKSGVTNVPTSDITGDIGVSPAAASDITGSDLVLVGEYATSSQVTGKIYASDYDVPTPTNLTTAISAMETAYVDAAGRTDPDHTELASGEIGGLTLPAGLYKWSNTVLISTNVTLEGGPNDTWIFQIAGGLTQAAATQIILSGGAQAKNIIWQVADVVSLDTTAHFEGTILCQTTITLNTGATVNGRLMAQTAVTLDSNTIVEE